MRWARARADAADAWARSGSQPLGSNAESLLEEEEVEECAGFETALEELLYILRDPLCKLDGRAQLEQVLLADAAAGSEDGGHLAAADAGCVWHERVTAKSSRQKLLADARREAAAGGGHGSGGDGGDLDLERFNSLLEKGNAFAIPQTNAKKHWPLGPLEKKIEKNATGPYGPFSNLAELLRPTGRMGLQFGSNEPLIPDQRSRHTMKSWLAQTDPTLPKRARPEVPDKLLHWAIAGSPRIHELLHLPTWLVEANWLGEKLDGATFETKLQLVHAHQATPYHRDNGGADTWMKLLAGKVVVACWSQADGIAYGLESEEMDEAVLNWHRFRRMPSARLFVLTKGDVLVMPAGTYHYVYTAERKIVVAGDFLNGSCWERRHAVRARDAATGVGKSARDQLLGLEEIRARREKRDALRCASRASGHAQ